MLSDAQRERLRRTGVVRVAGVVDPARASELEARVWRHFERSGVDRADARTWPEGFQSKLQALRRAGAFNDFAAGTTELLDDVLGAGAWRETEAWGPALVTFPSGSPWELPHSGWHLDLPGVGDPDQSGAARLFGFVTGAEPRGGGTLVVEGSHELVRRMVVAAGDAVAGSAKQLAGRLKRDHAWFRALTSSRRPDDRALWDGDEVDGVRVRVAELTGDAGDVALMLPWTLHAISPNGSNRPRMMVTHSVYRSDQRFFPAVPVSDKRGPAVAAS